MEYIRNRSSDFGNILCICVYLDPSGYGSKGILYVGYEGFLSFRACTLDWILIADASKYSSMMVEGSNGHCRYSIWDQVPLYVGTWTFLADDKAIYWDSTPEGRKYPKCRVYSVSVLGIEAMV